MIKFTQGDAINIVLTAQNGVGQPINLTGAVLTTYFRGVNGATITFPNSQHTINPDQVDYTGQFTLALAASDTQNIPIGINKEIVTQVVQGGSTVYFHGLSACTVLNPVPTV